MRNPKASDGADEKTKMARPARPSEEEIADTAKEAYKAVETPKPFTPAAPSAGMPELKSASAQRQSKAASSPKKSNGTSERAKTARGARPPKKKKASTEKEAEAAAVTVTITKSISLAALSEGMPGLTPACAQSLAEAAAVCLESRSHQARVRLPRHGLMPEDLHLEWSPVDDQQRRTYADMQEVTELGACGVAILVVREATAKVVVERSKKGTGFDYWLGDNADDDGPLFGGKTRLEVSGILAGTQSQIVSRMKQKKGQIAPSDQVAPGLVAVVEFGTPIACLESK